MVSAAGGPLLQTGTSGHRAPVLTYRPPGALPPTPAGGARAPPPSRRLPPPGQQQCVGRDKQQPQQGLFDGEAFVFAQPTGISFMHGPRQAAFSLVGTASVSGTHWGRTRAGGLPKSCRRRVGGRSSPTHPDRLARAAFGHQLRKGLAGHGIWQTRQHRRARGRGRAPVDHRYVSASTASCGMCQASSKAFQAID